MTINRRTFLHGSALSAISAMLPGAAGAATPIPLRAPLFTRATSTLASNALVATKFNAGRSQINMNFLTFGASYPFLNLLKTAQNWSLRDNSGYPAPDTLDSDGYPVTITNTGVYTVFDVPPQTARPGNYVATWSGNGTIYIGMANTAVSGSKISTSGSGRYVFSTTATQFSVGIAAIGNPRITNLQVFHADDEAALVAGQVFGVKFKQRLQEANFGVIRFLNWQNGNTTNVTTWATRKPTTYAMYGGTDFRPGIYAGVTTNSGADYSATLPGFQLADKATVIVKFNASTNGPCTLNVSGTGKIQILSEYAEPLTSSSYPIGASWQSIATLIYDATLNGWIKHGADNARGSCGIDNGCPPELMVQLCAEVGAHPHFVTPPLAIDPATDYMPSLAAYCRDNAPVWMVPRFEGPNELWNNASGFYQTHYANAKAKVYGWGGDWNNWYGKVMSVLGQIVSAAYAGNRARYQVLCGVQTGTGNTASGAASSNARLASTKYVAQSTPAQAPYTKTPASSWVTHVCCAQYFAGSEYNTPQEASDAANYAAAVAAGDVNTQITIASAYASTVNSGSGLYTLTSISVWYKVWKAWAQSFGITKMCGYEGGYSPDYTGGGKTAVDKLKAASKNAASMYGFTITNYNNFVGLSDSGFTAEFPSCFQLSGRTPSNNAWSVLEDVYQSPNPPQWNAIMAFNAA